MPAHQKSLWPFLHQAIRFSANQRRAVLMAAVVTTATVLLLHHPFHQPLHAAGGPVFEVSALQQKLTIPEQRKGAYFRKNTEAKAGSSGPAFGQANRKTPSLQPVVFNPNRVTMQALLEMGVPEKSAASWMKFLAKGGRFRRAEDLNRLYALPKEMAAALIPFAQIPPETTGNEARIMATIAEGEGPAGTPVRPKVVVDINLADSITLMALPGIGAKRASAILKYRAKLGGFVSVEQVGETWGLPDSVFQKIKPGLKLGKALLQPISLNTASEATLKAHPYIGWQLAKIIVAYREHHGPYQKIEDLLKIHVVEPEWLEKVRPYLTAEN